MVGYVELMVPESDIILFKGTHNTSYIHDCCTVYCPVGEKYMLILSCQREILPMLSIGQTDMSVGKQCEEHYATKCFVCFPVGRLGWPRRYPFN